MGNPIAAAVVALVLAGCASVTSAPRPLVLIDVPEPPHLAVTIVGHPDARGDVTHQLFYAADMQTAQRDLLSLLAPKGFRAGSLVSETLARAATKPDRSVTRARDPQAERESLIDDYSKLPGSGRIVDVVPVAIGYWTTYSKQPFKPWVVLEYRVYDADNQRTVASGEIGAGPSPNSKQMAVVADDDRFAFESFDAIRADPDRALAGLRATIEQVTAALAARL